jgi:sulfite exporter TauE/SafE
MSKVVMTHIQLFLIGLTFGMAGPCLLSCGPVLVTYLTAKKRSLAASIRDTFVFLSGRLLAYLLLGYLAGLSAVALKKFLGPQNTIFLKPLAGAISIFFGFIVIFDRRQSLGECPYSSGAKVRDTLGLAALGFVIGLSPCAPLIALLSEIALISKTAFSGILYALSFGLGTFISGIVVIGAVTGILTILPAKFLRSETGNTVFRVICGMLLVMMGLIFIFGGRGI